MLEALVREHPETWGYRYNLALNLRSLSLRRRHERTDGRGRGDPPVRTGSIEERMIREHPDASNYYYQAALVYLNFPAECHPRRDEDRSR